jgi:hypothetical protein
MILTRVSLIDRLGGEKKGGGHGSCLFVYYLIGVCVVLYEWVI